MKFDKKQIALSVAGILAGLVLTYLLWRVEQRNQANAAQQESDASAAAESALANQQAEIASLPQVSVPSISSTPSTTSTTTSSDNSTTDSGDGTDSILEKIIAGFQSHDNTSVTSTSNPIGAIDALPLPTTSTIPPVVVPQIQDFSANGNQGSRATFNHITTTGQ